MSYYTVYSVQFRQLAIDDHAIAIPIANNAHSKPNALSMLLLSWIIVLSIIAINHKRSLEPDMYDYHTLKRTYNNMSVV